MTMAIETDGRATATPEGTIFAMVPLRLMFLDSAYGRHTNLNNLNRLRTGWDILKMGTLYVSLRDDGRYAVIDGWHRKLVAQTMGETELACYVYLDLSLAQEADLYRAFATVFSQTSLDKFRARLVAGEFVAVQIDRAVHEAELEINYTGRSPTRNSRIQNIRSVVALEELYQNFGYAHLVFVLEQVQLWFPDAGRAINDAALRGASHFLAQYFQDTTISPHADLKRIRARCLHDGFDVVWRRAESIRIEGTSGLAISFGKALRATYNKGYNEGNQNLLSDWKDKYLSPGGKQRIINPEARARAVATNKLRHAFRRRVVFTTDEINGAPD